MTPPDTPDYALPSPAARRSTAHSGPRSAQSGTVAERLRARKHRVSQIRRRVAAIAATLFLASSGGILLQMATGNDPALAAAAARTAAADVATKQTGATTTSNTGTANGTGSSSSGTSSSGSSSSGTTTAVTTSAS